MAQHDYNIANQTGANFRTDLNNALLAISSNNSGSSEPSTMYAYEWWIDTSNNVLKLRNSSNNAWITMPFSITADNTVDINAGTVNGITSLSFSSGATVTSILDEDNLGSDSATALATQQSIKAYVDSQVTAQDLDISDGSSTIAIDLDSETLSLLGGTGVTSTASGNGVTFAIGQSVGTSDNVVFNQVTSALVGNASTATALATARTISGVSFDGTANITLDTDDIGEGTTNKYFTAERVDDQVNTLLTAGANISLTYDDAAGTLTIANTNSADITSVVAGDGLTGGGTSGDVTLAVGVDDSSIEINSDALRVKASGITNAMLAGSIANAKLANSSITVNSQAIALGGSHTFDTDDIGEGSSNLYYTDTRANSAIDARVTNTFINNLSGVVADTATALATGRTIGLSGDVTATGVSFDGTGNITLSTTIAANSVALGTDTSGNYVSTIAGTTNEIEVSGSGSETATVTIGLPDDVTIAGNLTVNGTTTTVNSDTLSVTDPLIKLAKANSGADSLDIGFYGLYDTSGSQDLYAGLFRDANDSGKFKLFKDLQVEPTTTVNTSGTGYAVGTLVSNLEGNVTGNVTGQVSTLSNHDTDNLSEGSSNLYFTNARSRSAISASGDISYNSSTGVISFTQSTAPVTSVNSATGAVTLDTDDIAEGSSNLYFTNARADTRINLQTGSNLDLSSKSTSDLSEGTNLYYTDTRFDTRLGTKTTDNLTEGSSNLYMTTERVQDIVGGMVTGNTETGITVTYDDSDGTLDFVVGTLNQDTTGNAATATALQTARNIGGVSFDGTGNIDLAGVNTSGNQDTSGNAATATALATGRNFSITGDITASAVSFDGTGNVALSAGIDANTVGISELNVSDGSNGQVLTTDGAGNLSFSTASGTTINNNANNRVITGSDSANTLEGEANFVFDGNNVGIGETTVNSKLEIKQGSGNWYEGIRINRSSNTTQFGTFSNNSGATFIGAADTSGGSNNALLFGNSTDGTTFTERMRIDSSGDVLIGQTSQTGYTFAQKLVVGDGDANDGITIQSGSTHQGNLAFNHSDGTTAHGRISYQHNSNYMAFFTNNTERVRIDPEGNISFGTQKVDPNWSQFFNAISGNYGGHLSFQNNNVPVTSLGNNFYINNSTLNERVLAYPAQQLKLDHQQNFLFESAASGTAGATFSFTEKMRLNSSGNLLIGTTTDVGVAGGGIRLTYPTSESDGDVYFSANGGGSNANPFVLKVVSQNLYDSGVAAMYVGRHSGNSRSINAGGTVNASGTDYAEYMKKADSCGTIAKGDVCGVDSTGKLTDVFNNAISFVIKSTDPSYVGGDTWGSVDLNLTDEQYETERQKHDRIAFSGQVPVNITGSFNVGDYVYPQANGSAIQCVAKSNPTFEEYKLCVGKIWATQSDGRPLVAVKIG